MCPLSPLHAPGRAALCAARQGAERGGKNHTAETPQHVRDRAGHVHASRARIYTRARGGDEK